MPGSTSPSAARAVTSADSSGGATRLEILKALGDNTRYAIYLELVRSPRPLATADVASSLGLHVNTVRPHLERMREVGLLDVTPEARHGVGRPQNLYSLARDAPTFGLEPPPFPHLARLLLRLIDEVDLAADDALEVGREEGHLQAARIDSTGDVVDVLMADQSTLGFDPARADSDDGAMIAFGNCPYGELAAQHSEVVCSLHGGQIEGLVDACGGAEVVDFRSRAHRVPCQVELALA